MDRICWTCGELTLTFYRYNGTDCLAVLNDGTPVTTTRTNVIDIVEAINALVLN